MIFPSQHQGRDHSSPDSVGKHLTSEALVFEGGKTMTSTDIAVASGLCENIGNKERVRHIEEHVRIGPLKDIKRKIEAVVNRMKVRLTFSYFNCFKLDLFILLGRSWCVCFLSLLCSLSLFSVFSGHNIVIYFM